MKNNSIIPLHSGYYIVLCCLFYTSQQVLLRWNKYCWKIQSGCERSYGTGARHTRRAPRTVHAVKKKKITHKKHFLFFPVRRSIYNNTFSIGWQKIQQILCSLNLSSLNTWIWMSGLCMPLHHFWFLFHAHAVKEDKKTSQLYCTQVNSPVHWNL